MGKVILAVVASASALTAHATAAQGQVAPATTSAPQTTIVFSDKGPNGMTDVPMGVHRIPDSNVIISGHQKGGPLGLLFGLPGMLIQSTANAEAGTGKVRNVQDDLRFDVTAKAAELTATILAEERYRQQFTLSPNAGGSTLTITPYVVITFQKENGVRPYVVLKTKPSSGSSNQPPRTIKYFCCEGKPLPLSGESGITENDVGRLKEIMTSELETAIHVMLLDRSQPYPRDDQAKISVRGYLPYGGQPIKFKGYDIGRYNDFSVIEFRGSGVLSGVNIAEPSSLEITTGKAK